MFEVSDFKESDKEQWGILWRSYERDDASEERIQRGINEGWENVLNNPEFNSKALKLKNNGCAVGLVTYVEHPYVLSKTNECYLSNLFVMEEYRRKGGARLLIDSVLEWAKEKGLYRVKWITEPDNKDAQMLYNKISDPEIWLQYKVKV